MKVVTLTKIVNVSQGRAVKVVNNSTEYKKDKFGITQPNLHRRIDIQPVSGDEVKQRDYELGVYGTHSYRTTTVYTHDEDSTTDETP